MNRDDDLPSCKLNPKLRRLLRKWDIQVISKAKTTLFTSLPTQHEKVEELDCSEVYRIQQGNCEQKYIGERGRKIRLNIRKHQRLCRHMDKDRSEIVEHIVRTGHEITERLATYG
ncbi:unnamed protein product [Protopolystoma xenopodis]|uniref:GIY-YIG domain-containing protein n=1 Tax=Protopolystoma xenopodis TaxID=117903 RepID=A0A3S5AD14_9PLAT|nr:unnamed protein product [Protopolystoma xenopodis]